MKMRLISYGTMLFLTLICLAGTAAARVINDPEYGFQITIPNNWQTNSFLDGTDKVWAFAAPDNNAAIRIRSFKAPAGLTMEALISAFETHVLSGGQRLTIAPYTLNGINGKMAGYKGQFNNTDVGVGCFFTIQKKHAYIVWSMIPVSLFNARSVETDNILNTFTLSGIRAPHQKDVQRQITGEWTVYTGGFVGSADEMKTFYKGTLVISSNGTILNATINFDVYNRVEVLQSVKLINDQLTFTRPGVPQYYQARLSGGKLFGTFQHQQHTQRWWAEKKTVMRDTEDRDFQYQMLVLDDSGFEFLYPKHFQRFQQSEGQSQWADPHAAVGSRVVMAMQTMSRSMGNSLTSVHGKLINQVRGNSAAKLLSSNQLRVNGIPAYELRFTLRQQNQLKYFYYLVMDVQGPNVAAVSFVGPESMLKEIKQHFDKLKASVKQTGTSAIVGPEPDATGECRSLGEVYTDGTGDNRTKKRGGTYLAIPKANIPLTSSLNINVQSGNFSYVTVHARYNNGTWSTAYQGPLTKLSVNQFKSFLSQPKCTHLIVSVNGAHEVYSSVPCKAEIKVCQGDSACRSAGDVYTDGTGDNRTKNQEIRLKYKPEGKTIETTRIKKSKLLSQLPGEYHLTQIGGVGAPGGGNTSIVSEVYYIYEDGTLTFHAERKDTDPVSRSSTWTMKGDVVTINGLEYRFNGTTLTLISKYPWIFTKK